MVATAAGATRKATARRARVASEAARGQAIEATKQEANEAMSEQSIIGLCYEIRVPGFDGDWIRYCSSPKESEAYKLYEAAKKKNEKVRMVKVVETEIERQG